MLRVHLLNTSNNADLHYMDCIFNFKAVDTSTNMLNMKTDDSI